MNAPSANSYSGLRMGDCPFPIAGRLEGKILNILLVYPAGRFFRRNNIV
jgi:hypothetical protein